MPKVSLFVRESTGLVKEATLLDASMLNVANMGAGLALFTGVTPFIIPGASLWLASLLTFIFTLPLVVVYTYLIMSIPRTGGDYVWLSRILGGKVGSVMGVALALNMPPFFALAAFFSVSAINMVLTVIGTMNKNPSLLWLASRIFVNPYGTLTPSQEWLIYGLSALAFGLMILVNILKPRWGYLLTSVLGLMSIVGIIIASAVIAVNIPVFHIKITRFISELNIQPTANYTHPISINLYTTLYMTAYIASFAYIWLYAGPAVAAELRSWRAIKYNEVLGSVITAIVLTVPLWLMDYAAGYTFNLEYYPTYVYNFWTVAMALAGNEALQWIIGLTLIAWEYFVMSFGIIVFARYVFAFAFDRLFPEVFARLNRQGSPVYAHLLDLLVTLVFLSFPILLPTGYEALYSYTPLAIVYLILVSLAGLRLSLSKGIRGLTLASVLSWVFLGFLGYEAFTNPYFGVVTITKSGSVVPYLPGIAYVASLIGIGALTYALAKVHRLRTLGIDIDAVYREIPPE